MPFLHSLHLQGILSFAPSSEPIALAPLNVLIGPNGSGKSNLIEAVGLLNWLPTSFSAVIRAGGGIDEWQWKGAADSPFLSRIEAVFDGSPYNEALAYQLEFGGRANRTEIMSELLGLHHPGSRPNEFFENIPGARNVSIREQNGENSGRRVELDRSNVKINESIFSQRKAPDLYPELTWVSQQFESFRFFRDWTFGRDAAVRNAQRADLPADELLRDGSNLAILLNTLDHAGQLTELNSLVKQFLPRFERISTRLVGGVIEVFIHEQGLKLPIPATRLSDGTLRFIAMLAVLLMPKAPAVLSLEEPELGLHPDAIAILAEVMVEAKERTQLIVTTHSDALVSALTDHVDSVLVCEYHQGTTIQRLEAAKLQSWLEDYRLGEIWRIGALGGNP